MTKTKRKIFWITQKWPLPADDGARRATYHLVKGLTAQGIDLELCAIVPEGEKTDVAEAQRALGPSKVHVVTRQPARHLSNLLLHPTIPLTFAPFAPLAVTRQIEAAIGDRKDLVVVFDGLHAAASVLTRPEALGANLRSLPKVYRAHNVEKNLWVLGARQKKNPLASAFLRYQALLVGAFEKRVCELTKLTATVSDIDSENFRLSYGGGFTTANTPIGIDLDTRAARESFPRERKILFIGRLDWPPNRDGLKWFLENVWPEAVAAAPDLKLAIAGAGDGEWLKPFLGLPGITFLGRVAEVAPAYQDSIASLVPVFFGSGTRVKAIEASSFARPCISTAIGIEGIGLDPATNYYNAETKEDWLRVLKNLSIDDARKRGSSAFTLIQEKFDPIRVAGRLLENLEKAIQS
ncbi:MAG: glycosyltransferase [Deltaproteobacteria bacterium]|nr:glycosyltransferase [Deltaproteobacteria bacterium]